MLPIQDVANPCHVRMLSDDAPPEARLWAFLITCGATSSVNTAVAAPTRASADAEHLRTMRGALRALRPRRHPPALLMTYHAKRNAYGGQICPWGRKLETPRCARRTHPSRKSSGRVTPTTPTWFVREESSASKRRPGDAARPSLTEAGRIHTPTCCLGPGGHETVELLRQRLSANARVHVRLCWGRRAIAAVEGHGPSLRAHRLSARGRHGRSPWRPANAKTASDAATVPSPARQARDRASGGPETPSGPHHWPRHNR